MSNVDNQIADVINKLPEDQQKIVTKLDKLIRKALPGLTIKLFSQKFWGGTDQNIIGYGDYTMVGRSGKEVKWFLVGLAAQKNYTSLYITAVDGDNYLVKNPRYRLGKVKIGSSSVSFKKLEDLNLDELVKVLKRAKELTPKVS